MSRIKAKEEALSQILLHNFFEYCDGKLLSKVERYKWKVGKEVGTATNSTGYRAVMINGYLYNVHRLIFFMFHGCWPDLVDHVDRDRSNNRIENLRSSNKSLNALNSDKHGRRRKKCHV